jgi:hypothetical protein
MGSEGGADQGVKEFKTMWIMISGPYTSGAKTEEERQKNLDGMNQTAYEVFLKGHVPIIGVNMALPVIQAVGADKFDEIMMPLSLALAERCDAVLRVGGSSKGADQEVERFRKNGKLIFGGVSEIPEGE